MVFAVFFGFAASRLPESQRRPLVTVFEAVAETMIIIVRWVLLAAPLGVFALGLGVGLSAGVGAAALGEPGVTRRAGHQHDQFGRWHRALVVDVLAGEAADQLTLLAAMQRADKAGQLQASVDGAAQRISHGESP